MSDRQANTGQARPSARQARADDVRTRIVAVATSATETDRRTVQEILSRAASGEYGSKTHDLTPGVAALLFIEHNPHNRDWDPSWTLELARRMTAHLWKKNNEPPGFYKDGALADSQHRLAAAALAAITWTTVIVFGMDREAVMTIDAGRRRDAASALKMDGMHDAKLKQSIATTMPPSSLSWKLPAQSTRTSTCSNWRAISPKRAWPIWLTRFSRLQSPPPLRT
jgi:hypothetical protein